jgi:thiol-disulfide isomerase/thioredoxin
MKYFVSLALLAALAAPRAALANEHFNNNLPHEKGFGSLESRGAHRTQNAGALAPSLQGQPVVVRIHADWCPACYASAGALQSAIDQFKGKVHYVQFDVTSAKTAAVAAQDAQKLGLAKFFEATKAATSTVAVIDPKTGDVVAEFYADTNSMDYVSAIEKTQQRL